MSEEKILLYKHIWNCKSKMRETRVKSFKAKEIFMKKFFADEVKFWERRANAYIKELNSLDVT